MNLDRVRDALGTLIGPDTAIVGHGWVASAADSTTPSC
jgi:predicted enzyme related to lactoylglutathione lyase